MNFQKYIRKKEAKQNENQIPTLILIIQTISNKLKQETEKIKILGSQNILLNLEVKIIFQPQKMKLTTLKPHTKEL